MNLITSSGKPIPYGVHSMNDFINFSIYSSQATQVVLQIYNIPNKNILHEIKLDPLVNKTGDIWHISIQGIPEEFAYAYWIQSHDYPESIKNKIIVSDPYAKMLVGMEKWGDTERNLVLSAYKNLKYDWEFDTPINIPLKESIVYEMHVRGFTKHMSSMVNSPGTYQGVIEKIPYLKDLGITTVELLPIFEFDENNNHFKNPQTNEKLKNYWGYNTINFFTPKAAYASSSDLGANIIEFKNMVKEFHKNGMEVILDVVYNHFGESVDSLPTISLKYIDHMTYYILDDKRHHTNFTGCGNTINCNHPVVKNLILDSLRYWVTEMHVDGFRFDLAAIFSRGSRGEVLSHAPIFAEIDKDPILANTKIIAEPWDASGLSMVGAVPGKRWVEWNGEYRDCIRKYIKGDQGQVQTLATRLSGSSDIFSVTNRKPFHSINFITCHDGFTLNDLVSYNEKNNILNGEENRDGNNANWSWDCLLPNEKISNKTMMLRQRQIKNMLSLLLLSQGIPMLLAGDEFGRTQKGNNNAYCQDNDISWIDWSLLDKNSSIYRFLKILIQFRKENSNLRRDKFYSGESSINSGYPDISWHGKREDQPDFASYSHLLAFLIASGPDKSNYDIYTAINPMKTKNVFMIPPPLKNKKWYLFINTFLEAPFDICDYNQSLTEWNKQFYVVEPNSVISLIAK